jgi:hypothetical protein
MVVVKVRCSEMEVNIRSKGGKGKKNKMNKKRVEI